MSDLNGKTCPFCGEGHLNLSTKDKEYNYQGHTLLIPQLGIYCDVCEEAILKPSHLKATRVDLQEFRARIDGIVGPRAIRKIRKQIGLNQQEAALLLGGGKNAFSRYEQGELSPPKAVSQLLKLFDKHPELVKELN
jgi:HTH-type transcriptional regulator/antitoxin MqsA